ncbi:hypothetical protein DL96DRAFT_392493 [Flagelloscypha sp. PMI_526]|nr:hypothetical protein DL96DRAFT_392493 [Flagelloscypha sp. PMI_526]
MPSFTSVVKRVTLRSSKTSLPSRKPQDAQFAKDVKLDYCITSARLLKAAGENLPVPWLKGVSDLVLQVLEPLKLARTNKQDFDALAQDILDTLTLIQDQAARMNLEGSPETNLIEMKCASFTKILQDISKDFEAVKLDTVGTLTSAWTTPTMQRLIQSYQSRLQKEVQMFNLSNLVDIHASVQILTMKIDATLTAPMTNDDPLELENYRSLKAGDLRVVAARIKQELNPDTECHALYEGEKTWKTFRGSDAEKRWVSEIQFYHAARLQPHVRQLFGFIKSRAFLGLVFHDHMASLHDVWNRMAPVEMVFSLAQWVLWSVISPILNSQQFGLADRLE